MTDKVQKIKEEIERRFNDNMKASEQYTENSKSRALFTSAAKEDYDLLAFIDSLPEEHNEDLEEEISNYIKDNFFGSKSMGFLSNRTKGELDSVDVANIARHFAEWQTQKDQESGCEADFTTKSEDFKKVAIDAWNNHVGLDLMYVDEVIAFANEIAEWQKQQMMKDACDTKITTDKGSIFPIIKYRLPLTYDCKIGDKVKLIIIKEE